MFIGIFPVPHLDCFPIVCFSIICLLFIYLFFILFPGVLHLGDSFTFFKTMPQIVSTYQGLMILCKVLEKKEEKKGECIHIMSLNNTSCS